MSDYREILVAGLPSQGPALILSAPISFWGGIDPATAKIIDVRHPEHGANIAGTALFLPGTIGSSSASAVLLELVRRKLAPSAIIMHEVDAILLIGLISAREMGWPIPMAIKLDRAAHDRFRGQHVAIKADGQIASIGK